MQARFITFEGVDGAGKSTHLAFVRQWLAERGIAAVFTREPGGTELGERLRDLLLDVKSQISLDTETLLMFAARMEHIAQVIRPALQRGEWVISDRFTDATFAYQGGGRGVPTERISQLENWVQQGLQPDLTLLFDVPLEIAQQRMSQTRTLDRFEQEAAEFHLRVREAYLSRAKADPARFAVLDASQSIAATERSVEVALNRLISS